MPVSHVTVLWQNLFNSYDTVLCFNILQCCWLSYWCSKSGATKMKNKSWSEHLPLEIISFLSVHVEQPLQITLSSSVRSSIKQLARQAPMAPRKYRLFIENCVFSQFTATHPLLEGEQFILSEILVYSHSYWLAVFFPTNNSSPVPARERPQNIENSWKKSQYFMNTLYLSKIMFSRPHYFVSLCIKLWYHILI